MWVGYPGRPESDPQVMCGSFDFVTDATVCADDQTVRHAELCSLRFGEVVQGNSTLDA